MVQVEKEHYEKKYDTLMRFISYFHQIDSVKKVSPESVLEIGVGSNTVSDYLKRRGVKVTTCDIDKNLNPDHVADVRKLPFEDHQFDLILICEVLEHIPYEDQKVALSELKRVSKKNVIISVPYSQLYLNISLVFPFLKRIFKREFLNIFFGIRSFQKMKFDGQHYWEIGRRGCSLKKVRDKLKEFFVIKHEKRALPHPTHYFFILEKTKT